MKFLPAKSVSFGCPAGETPINDDKISSKFGNFLLYDIRLKATHHVDLMTHLPRRPQPCVTLGILALEQ